MTIQRDNKLITEIDKVAEASYDSVQGSEAQLEEALRVSMSRNGFQEKSIKSAFSNDKRIFSKDAVVHGLPSSVVSFRKYS